MNAEGLDAIDYQILTLLYKDARITFSEIGQEVGLSRVAVKNRITAMEQCGIILGYKAVIDTTKVPGRLFMTMDEEAAPEDDEMEALQMSERCQAAFDEIRALVPDVNFSAIRRRTGGRLKFPMYLSEEARNAELEVLDLTVRSLNCLHRAGFQTVGQLVEGISSYEDLKKIRNCGVKSIDEIMGSLFCYQYEQYEIPEKIKYIMKIVEMNE